MRTTYRIHGTAAMLTYLQLVDSAPHYCGHGMQSPLTYRSSPNKSQVLTGILRHYAMILLQTAPKKQELPKIRQQRALVRGINLRANANVLSPASFQARKAYMVSAFQEGKFLAEPEARGKPRPNPMSDPAAMEGMMGMMKGNMAMMIPQTLIMGWINAFFSGFVISELRTFLFLLDGLAKHELRTANGDTRFPMQMDSFHGADCQAHTETSALGSLTGSTLYRPVFFSLSLAISR